MFQSPEIKKKKTFIHSILPLCILIHLSRLQLAVLAEHGNGKATDALSSVRDCCVNDDISARILAKSGGNISTPLRYRTKVYSARYTQL